MTAVPANESARPAQPLKVVQAVVVSAEPGKELAGRSRVVRARDWCRHATSLVRLSGYPSCAFLQGTLAYRLSAAWLAVPSDAGALPLGAGTSGKSRMTVSPPPVGSGSRAVPPFEVTRRWTMARPSPVP